MRAKLVEQIRTANSPIAGMGNVCEPLCDCCDTSSGHEGPGYLRAVVQALAAIVLDAPGESLNGALTAGTRGQ
jgi:hypothetical protein